MQILLELRLVSLPLYHARLSILTFDFLDVRASSLHSPMKSRFVDGTRWRRHRKQLMTNKCSCKSKNVLIKPQRFFQSLLAPGTHTVYKLVLQLNPFASNLDSLWWFACPVLRELATRPYICHFRCRLPGKAFQTVFEQHPDSLVRVVQV